MITADPPEQVAAIVSPLRDLADEIVIAVDVRLDPIAVGRYTEIADTVHRIEVSLIERHLGWLHAQCRGDWILKLDADEVPSAAFLGRLPELIADRAIVQYWVARGWLYPDADRILEALPWALDFNNRLVRNGGGLSFPGQIHVHAAPAHPSAYIEEPVYHLALLLEDEEARRGKAVRYEVSRPHLRAPGGGRANEAFYLPELRPSLAIRKVPSVDRDAISQVIHAGSNQHPSARAVELPVVPSEDVDRHWARRTYPGTTYAAKIEPYHSSARIAPHTHDSVFVRVTNLGSETFPGRPEENPPIRLAYRLLNRDGSVHVAEGARTPFPCAVPPGKTVLVPVAVASTGAGDYVLEIDIVHEFVRWFGCEARIPLEVGDVPGLAPLGQRLRETRPPRLQRMRRQRIPRALHRVWLGSAEMPEEVLRYGASWQEHHPGWELRLWTDADLRDLDLDAVANRARSASELSNAVRYEVLRRHGGVYVDTDVECRRPIEPLLRGIDAFAVLELPGRVGTAVLGAVPGHTVFERAAREARRTLGLGEHSADANGPYFLSLVLEQQPGVAILGADTFYPFRWNQPERRNGQFPDAYGVHHFSETWKDDEGV